MRCGKYEVISDQFSFLCLSLSSDHFQPVLGRYDAGIEEHGHTLEGWKQSIYQEIMDHEENQRLENAVQNNVEP